MMDVRPPQPKSQVAARQPLVSTPNKLRRFMRRHKRVIITIAVIMVTASLVVGGYVVFHNSLGNNNNVSSSNSQDQLNETVAKVGKLMLLPAGEQPTLATISDVSKLSGQVFFTNAQNGDKILVYAQSRKAILYRPSINKLIEVAPISQTPSK